MANMSGKCKAPLKEFLALACANCSVKNISVTTIVTFKVMGRMEGGNQSHPWKQVTSAEPSQGLPTFLILSAEDVSRDTGPSVAHHNGGLMECASGRKSKGA